MNAPSERAPRVRYTGGVLEQRGRRKMILRKYHFAAAPVFFPYHSRTSEFSDFHSEIPSALSSVLFFLYYAVFTFTARTPALISAGRSTL